MNHNPYEDWIFDEGLKKEQRIQLNAHLDQCESCRKLADANTQTLRLFDKPATIAPSAGFTSRWVEFANRRQAVEQKRQVKLVFGLLTGFAFLSLIVLFYLYYQEGIPFGQMISGVIFNIIETIQRAIILLQSYRFVLTVLPIRIPVLVWIILGANLVFWAAFWSLSIMKFTYIKRAA